MRVDSDIDLFIVGRDDQREEIVEESGTLESTIFRWTGNDTRAIVMTVSDVDAHLTTDPLLAAIAAEGRTVAGHTTWLRRRQLRASTTSSPT